MNRLLEAGAFVLETIKDNDSRSDARLHKVLKATENDTIHSRSLQQQCERTLVR